MRSNVVNRAENAARLWLSSGCDFVRQPPPSINNCETNPNQFVVMLQTCEKKKIPFISCFAKNVATISRQNAVCASQKILSRKTLTYTLLLFAIIVLVCHLCLFFFFSSTHAPTGPALASTAGVVRARRAAAAALR